MSFVSETHSVGIPPVNLFPFRMRTLSDDGMFFGSGPARATGSQTEFAW